MADCILKMTGICKLFPGVKALDNAQIEVYSGEVHALMGENGAGKSTLMKVLAGQLLPDSGEIFFNGQTVRLDNTAHALSLGIAMIYQELNPIKEMSIAENIFLGREPSVGRGFLVDKKTLNSSAKELLKQFGMDIEPTVLMKKLSIAQMQMIEIIKAVSTGAKLIVMDEPTSSLTADEIKVLFSTVRELKEKGVAIIYISHRLEEIFDITDTVTIMRDGMYVGTEKTADIDRNRLITMMVGRELDSVYPKEFAEIGQPVLVVKNLSGGSRFRDISFDVKAGEIVGFYGLVGAGRSEVFRSIFGLDPRDSGTISVNGEELDIRRTSDAIANGIVMVTEDRKDTGLVLCRSVKENIALPNLDIFSKAGIISRRDELKACNEITRKIRIKMSSLAQITGNLSGGNQQKIVLSKWLIKSPKVLILDEPTRGIDVGAKSEIHSLMCSFAKLGMAIVMISSELPEVMGMSDRIIVMGEGTIQGEFRFGEYEQDDILKCALGGKSNNEN